MKEFLTNNIDIFVTIIGFVITYRMTTKSFSNEIRKSKISYNIEMIHSLPLELCNLMSKIQKSSEGKKNNSIKANEYEALMTKIFAYGSKEAVILATEIQQIYYKIAKTGDDYGRKLLILFSILISQLKYDISDEIISPESWLRLKINDYDDVKNEMKTEINEVISELDLNEKFYV